MMFLDPEAVFKKVSIVIGVVIVATATAATVWYNSNLKREFVEGKSETSQLRDTTVKLESNTDGLKSQLSSTSRELKNSIVASVEETKRIEGEMRQQNMTLKQLQQEYEKFKLESKIEMKRLQDANFALDEQIKVKERAFNEQIKQRDVAIERYKENTKLELNSLSESVLSKDKEIADLRSKLEKEIELRAKSTWHRRF